MGLLTKIKALELCLLDWSAIASGETKGKWELSSTYYGTRHKPLNECWCCEYVRHKTCRRESAWFFSLEDRCCLCPLAGFAWKKYSNKDFMCEREGSPYRMWDFDYTCEEDRFEAAEQMCVACEEALMFEYLREMNS